MPHFPTHQDENLLNEIRAGLISAQHQFREQICRYLEWSYPTFYENAAKAKEHSYQEKLIMLQTLAGTIENLENILIAMCAENGFWYGVQVTVNWHKRNY